MRAYELASLLAGLLQLCSLAAAARHDSLRLAPHQRVAAFYYIWYGAPPVDGAYIHWNHEILPHWNANERDKHPHGPDTRFQPPNSVHAPFFPEKGPYSSSDPAVIRAHLQEMHASNVSTLVISWWGPSWREGTHDTQGVNTDAVLGVVVKELEQQQDTRVKLAFHLEPYEGRTVQTVREDLQHLMDAYGSSPALLRIRGLPVYYVYDSYRIPADAWAKLLAPAGHSSVRGTQLDGVFIALMLQLQDGNEIINGGFDGCYTYFASDQVSQASQPANWPAIARWAEEHDMLFVASVGPGYDDSKIRPWNAGATRSRQDGERYRQHWEAAAASGAHAVSITSWNEFGEGTQIEPVQPWTDPDTGRAYTDYGEGGPLLYLNITQQVASNFIQQWHDKQAAAKQAGSSDGPAEGVVGEGMSAGGGASGAAAESELVVDTERVEL